MDKNRMISVFLSRFVAVLTLMAACVGSVRAATITWTGGGDGTNWFDSGNWSAGVPGNGDGAVINSGSVALTNVTGDLAALTMNGGTLTFSNWTTKLTATNVWIESGATMTLPAAFTNTAMSNRVWIACSNLFIASGGEIDADGKGYAGGTSTRNASGPGAGVNHSSNPTGGGYGGTGGGSGGGIYGSTNAPLAPGSGGGGRTTGGSNGGHGGGAIRIEASGSVTVNGTISANGGYGNARGGDASGGGIYITCRVFGGTNGIVRAEADNGAQGFAEGGGGGGGRIAVIYDTAAQSNAPDHSVRFSVNRSTSYGGGILKASGNRGTLYFPDSTVLRKATFVSFTGVLRIPPGFTSWITDNLLFSNCWLQIPNDNTLSVTVTSNMTVRNGDSDRLTAGGVEFYNLQLNCGGNLTITDGGVLAINSAMTNESTAEYGALVNVAGDVVLASTNCWIYPYSAWTNGGSVLLRMRDLTIATNDAGINADAKGFRGGSSASGFSRSGYGPGRGFTGSGESASAAGYGGKGGKGTGQATQGATYGSSNAPARPGSGGGMRNFSGGSGGRGGGFVWIEAQRTVTVNGIISANGGEGNQGAGGSGGGIYITCQNLAGDANGIIRADGGNGETGPNNYGGGGGGRIAVWRRPDKDTYQGSCSVTNGTAWDNGEIGTIYWGYVPPRGTIIYIH